MIDSQRHARLTALFLTASELPDVEAASFLDRECENDPTLKAEVEAMLASHHHNGSFLERPVMPRREDQRVSSWIGDESSPGLSEGPPEIEHCPKIDGYRITGVLGHGGMGIVYRAVQTTLNRPVALKVLPAMIGSTSPAAVTRFKREATAAARLHHTNIVAIHDFGQSHDTYFYAMELIEGQPLSVLIKKFGEEKIAAAGSARLSALIQQCVRPNQPSTVDSNAAGDSSGMTPGTSHGHGRPYFLQVARWIADAADALHYAHGQGIVHRDIKPANIILATDRRIMITDFGLAKSSGEQSVTMTGSLMGTIRYLSPEQAMAKRVPVNHRTDIYSLGATMYELLCFRPAFPGGDDKQVLAAIIARDPAPPRKVLASVPAELETICLKTLEKSPEKRYATARELAEDLRRFLQNLPIVAKRPNHLQRAIKFTRRRRAITVALVSALLLAALVGALYVQATLAREVEVRSLLKEGIAAYDANQWEEAGVAYEQVTRLEPDNLHAIINLANVRIQQFNDVGNKTFLDQAVDLCDRSLRIDPENMVALNHKGVALKIQGKLEEALESYQRAVVIDPNTFYTWANLAAINVLLRDLRSAEENLRKAASFVTPEMPMSCGVWRDLAVVQLLQRQPEASSTIARAMACNKDAKSLLVSARLRLNANEPKSAQVARDEAAAADILVDAKSGLVKRYLALANLRLHRFDEAIAYAKEAIKLDDMQTYNQLIIAVAEGYLGNEEASESAWKEAQDAWPEKLQNDSDYVPSAEKGFLWFESARDLLLLRSEAAAFPR